MNLQTQLNEFIVNPKNATSNFELANCYFSINQTSAAYSYYLRTAEYSTDISLVVTALLKAGNCLSIQLDHITSERAMYMHALAIAPDVKEIHYALSLFYEKNNDWISAYAYACTGLNASSDLYGMYDMYPGNYGLPFQKAVAGWWIGRHNESRCIFESLAIDFEYEMTTTYKQMVHNNIVVLNSEYYPMLLYTSLIYDNFNYKFTGLDLIKRNYSQAYQDMFVLAVLDGKQNGTYLEIGAGEPWFGNNTALLETKFNWNGISIDILQQNVNDFKACRKNLIYLADATNVDYVKLIEDSNLGNTIDYLQIDCDPASVTYDVLTKIPFDKYKFAVITYEHDFYADESKLYREKSRVYLMANGYKLIVADVALNNTDTYEDWWIHPDLISTPVFNKFKCVNSGIININNYMTGNIKSESIPVIGIPIINGVNWLYSLIDSIDYPVDNLFIINNNGRGEITKELDHIQLYKNDFIKTINIVHMPSNLGVAASWNMIIKSYLLAPYWVITNHDISFTPGFLKELVEKSKQPDIGVVFGRAGECGGAYELFLIKDQTIQKCGLFDENCYPAYCEDYDYSIRLQQNSIKIITALDTPYLNAGLSSYELGGSQTKKTEPILHERLNQIHIKNNKYLQTKWNLIDTSVLVNGIWNIDAIYKFPFNENSAERKFDLEFARTKYLGF